MARPRTIARVHDAVLALAVEVGAGALTMEGVAARAGVGKQTLYRTWPSTSAIVFDALLARSASRDDVAVVPASGHLVDDIEALLRDAIEEMTTEPGESLLRALAAQIQLDAELAAEFRLRLLGPQLDAVSARLRDGGVPRPAETTELLLAPVFYRWFMRSKPMPPAWVARHVRRVLADVEHRTVR